METKEIFKSQEQMKDISSGDYQMTVTSQLMSNTERKVLFSPSGKQIVAKDSNQNSMLFCYGKNDSNETELYMIIDGDGTEGNQVKKELHLSCDTITDFQFFKSSNSNCFLFCIVRKGEHTYLAQTQVEAHYLQFRWVYSKIDFEFEQWSVFESANAGVSILYVDTNNQFKLYKLTTNETINLSEYYKIPNAKAVGISIEDRELNGEYYMCVNLLYNQEAYQDEKDGEKIEAPIKKKKVSYSMFIIFVDGIPTYFQSDRLSSFNIPLATTLIGRSLENQCYNFVISNYNTSGHEFSEAFYIDYQIEIPDSLEKIEKDSSDISINLSCQKAFKSSGIIEDIQLANALDTVDNSTNLPLLFTKVRYEDKSNVSTCLLKLDPVEYYENTNDSSLWEVKSVISDIDDVSVSFNSLTKNVDIFVSEKNLDQRLQNHLSGDNILKYYTIDGETKLFNSEIITLQPTEEIAEYSISSGCTFVTFGKENSEQDFIRNADGEPVVGVSASSSCSVKINNKYYQLEPNVYTEITLNMDNTLAISKAVDSPECPVLFFTFDDTDKAFRLNSNYWASEKIQKLNSNSTLSEENINTLKELDSLSKTLNPDEALSIVSKNENSAILFAARIKPLLDENYYLKIVSTKHGFVSFRSEEAYNQYKISSEQPETLEWFGSSWIRDFKEKVVALAGDVINVCRNSLEKFKEITIKVASGVYEMIVEIGGKILTTIVKTFEDAWGFLSDVALKIWDTIQNAIKYIGYLLDLRDSTQYKDMLKGNIQGMIHVLRAFCGQESPLREAIHASMGTFKEFLESLKVDQNTKDVESPLNFDSRNVMKSTAEVGLITDQIRTNQSGSVLQSVEVLFSPSMLHKMKEIDTLILNSTNQASGSLIDIFNNMTLSFDGLMDVFAKIRNYMVDSLLSLLDGFEDIIMAVLDLFISLLDAADAVLNAPLSQIPFLGPILSAILGDNFSLLDFICYLIAIPSTILIKLLKTGKKESSVNVHNPTKVPHTPSVDSAWTKVWDFLVTLKNKFLQYLTPEVIAVFSALVQLFQQILELRSLFSNQIATEKKFFFWSFSLNILLSALYANQIVNNDLSYPMTYKTIFYLTGCIVAAVTATKIATTTKKVLYLLPTVIPIAGLVDGILKKEKLSYIISDSIEIFNGAADAYRGFVSEQSVYTHNNFLISSLARAVTVGGILFDYIYLPVPDPKILTEE